MKRGGQIIYSGELGQHSSKLIEYFEVRDDHLVISSLTPSFSDVIYKYYVGLLLNYILFKFNTYWKLKSEYMTLYLITNFQNMNFTTL